MLHIMSKCIFPILNAKSSVIYRKTVITHQKKKKENSYANKLTKSFYFFLIHRIFKFQVKRAYLILTVSCEIAIAYIRKRLVSMRLCYLCTLNAFILVRKYPGKFYTCKFNKQGYKPFSTPPSEFNLNPLSSINWFSFLISLKWVFSRWAEIVTWFSACPLTSVQAAYSLSLCIKYQQTISKTDARSEQRLSWNN